MIYPDNFETKTGFDEIRTLLKERCLSTLGKGKVDEMAFVDDADVVRQWMQQTREFRRIQDEADDFPLQFFFDVRDAIKRIILENTHLEENEIFDLRRSLQTINDIVRFLQRAEDRGEGQLPAPLYPALYQLAHGVAVFPQLTSAIDRIVDKYGHVKDNTSPELLAIRKELARATNNVSKTLYAILRSAQSEGLVDKDVTPTLRDGRLVIPVAPGMKRKIGGIVHDESATGKTVFVEPAEVVEANNRIRELESEERHEVIRILTVFTNMVRPHSTDILASYSFLAEIDFIRAKAEMARLTNAIEPDVVDKPHVDWIQARHPLLQLSLAKQAKKVVPLDIVLDDEKRILIISGPNAGGKSVCLKTVGLLQYMLQCGLSIPVNERSTTGMFHDIMIDIGDEQSLENDLSTYSSHLLNMKNMMKQANPQTLILIDEFGTGTEPQIGGAIAEAVLEQFCKKEAWGVITTHYQNLKHFADSHKGVVNGAMLYDRHEMKALFQLAIGRPGSSFAIEIARNIGLPEVVIRLASDIVGSDYIQSDKYLQDIVRDKRYWEAKRQAVHQREKELERQMAKYESDVAELDTKRKEILAKAKADAEELLKESNRRIENAIREIREQQAEKEETKKIREELNEFRADVADMDMKAMDEKIARKMEQIKQRKERHARFKSEKEEKQRKAAENLKQAALKEDKKTGKAELEVGDNVRIKGLKTVGVIEAIDSRIATVIFGDMRTKMKTDRLEYVEKKEKTDDLATRLQAYSISRATRETIDSHKATFKQDLDVRGMRGDEALSAVQYFIDDAILVGMQRVRILHGKGNGILRQLIRQYLGSVPNVTHFADEHVQFGGAGITVVDL